MMKFLHGTKDDVLTLSKGHGSIQLEWYIDASFAIHPDYRGHTGAVLKFKNGKGCPLQRSSKQKLNASSSTTSELIGVDDVLSKYCGYCFSWENKGTRSRTMKCSRTTLQ